MKRVDVINTVSRFHGKLVNAAVKLCDKPAPEDFHAFRVSFKKIRALIRFLNHTSQVHDQLNITDSLKSYYHSLGTLRDWQLLQQKLLADARSTDAEINIVSAAISKINEGISHVAVVNIARQAGDVLMKQQYHDCHLVEAELYLDDQWQHLSKIAERIGITAEDLHEFRKTLKDIFYAVAILSSPKFPLFAGGMLPGRSLGLFDSLLKDLGDFNDLSTEIMLLNSIKSNSNIFPTLYSEWKRNKENIIAGLASKITFLVLQRDDQLSS